MEQVGSVAEKIVRAAGLGGGIGTAVGIAISLIWQLAMWFTLPIGLVVGFIVGYMALDWRGTVETARRAWKVFVPTDPREIRERLWHIGSWAVLMLYGVIPFAFVIPFFLLGQVSGHQAELLILVAPLSLAWCAVVTIWWLSGAWNSIEDSRRVVILYNPVMVPAGWTIYGIVRVLILLAKVVWLTIRWIHSTPRLVAALDTVVGVAVGGCFWHVCLFQQLGAVPIYNLVSALTAIAAGAGVGWGFACLHCRLAMIVHLMPAEMPAEQ